METKPKKTRPQKRLRVAVQRVLRAVDKAVAAGEEARRARDEFLRLIDFMADKREAQSDE